MHNFWYRMCCILIFFVSLNSWKGYITSTQWNAAVSPAYIGIHGETPGSITVLVRVPTVVLCFIQAVLRQRVRCVQGVGMGWLCVPPLAYGTACSVVDVASIVRSLNTVFTLCIIIYKQPLLIWIISNLLIFTVDWTLLILRQL